MLTAGAEADLMSDIGPRDGRTDGPRGQCVVSPSVGGSPFLPSSFAPCLNSLQAAKCHEKVNAVMYRVGLSVARFC